MHTQLGRAIRATAEDPDTVGLVGVNARRVNAARGGDRDGDGGVAGAFLAMRATFDPYAGALQLIFAFEAAVIGGAGSLWGTLIGGIVLGVAQSIGALITPQGFFIAGHRRLPRRPVRAAVLRRLRRRACAAPSLRERRHERATRRSSSSAGRAIAASRSPSPRSRRRRCALRPGCCLSANVVDKLTTLFIYVILAVTWNALAGYCGLVSVGQQAFFGLGAYAAIRLADSGVSVYPALFLGALIVGALSLPLSALMLRLQGRRIRHRHVGRRRTRASPRQSRHAGAGRDRHLADRAQRLSRPKSRRALTYWCALAAMAGLLAIVFSLLRSRSARRSRRSATTRRPPSPSACGSIAPSASSSSSPPSARRSPARCGSRPRSPSSRRPISARSGPPT